MTILLRTLVVLLTGLMLLPVLALIVGASQADPEVWAHLGEHVLPAVFPVTVQLLLGVCSLTVVIGVSLAWVTTAYEFPGRRLLAMALLLPLAMPAYILAVVYLDWVAYPSVLPTWWRASGLGEFPLHAGPGLAIVTLSASLYSYVYLVVRQAFVMQGQRLIDAARLLGAGRWQVMWRVVLPMAWPWVAASALLVAMEVLADYATVAIFNVDTLTTTVFATWFSLYSKSTALKVAGLLLLLVLVLAGLERLVQRRHVDRGARHGQPMQRRVLRGWARLALPLGLTGFLGLVLIAPVLQLLLWQDASVLARGGEWLLLAGRSVMSAVLAAGLVCAVSLALAFSVRQRVLPGVLTWSRVATFGYAFPGVVLGVGLYWPLVQLDHWLADRLHGLGVDVETVLLGGLGVLFLAYLVRFLAVAHAPIQAGVHAMTLRHEESARLLGASGADLARRLYRPMLSGSVVTAMLLVSLDILKEVPMTLLMRPVGWETLPTKVFQFTQEGQWQQAATPALLLVLISLGPVAWLSRTLWRSESMS